MSAGAITVMVLGMVILWGGLATSIINAVQKAKKV